MEDLSKIKKLTEKPRKINNLMIFVTNTNLTKHHDKQNSK